MTYIPGDWYMICDRCGGQYRRSEMKEHWDGLWLCAKYCWEPQHPQDFVTGIPDNPSVPVARPDIVTGITETTLNGAVAENAMTAILTSATGLVDFDPVGIVMDNGATHWTFLNGDPSTHTITLGSPMMGAAADGNAVYLPSLNNENSQ